LAYVLLEALRRLGLKATKLAHATCGTIRLKLLKIGALVRISVRRVKIAMASAHPWRQNGPWPTPPSAPRADTNLTPFPGARRSAVGRC
jgi:hypothetical protein